MTISDPSARCTNGLTCFDAGCPDHGWDRENPDRCTGCGAASEDWCSCPDGYTREGDE